MALQAGLLWHPVGMTPWIDVISPAIVIAVVVLLWRLTPEGPQRSARATTRDRINPCAPASSHG